MTDSVIRYYPETIPAFKGNPIIEAVGVPFLAVNIYKLVQDYAIYSGEETFSAASFHTIASQKMRLTLEMRRALLSGKDVNLHRYLDLTPFRGEDFRLSVCQDMNPPEPPAPEAVFTPDIREMAVQTLLGLGLDRPTAAKHVPFPCPPARLHPCRHPRPGHLRRSPADLLAGTCPRAICFAAFRQQLQ